MPKLVFRVASDWEEVVKLRNEIAKLKQELKGMDSTQSPAAFKTLNTQLAASTQQLDGLVSKAAQAGAEMETGFKKKIFDASQVVNSLSEKIMFQRGTIQQLKNELSGLKDKYREALKQDGDTSSLEAKIRSTNEKLKEQKSALFNLTQEQANARLSVKKLRDEYELYNNDGKKVIETNNGMDISWKKALAVIGGAAALKQLGSEIIRVRGEFQSMQTAMETMVGKDVAGPLMAQVKELAKISPLTMTDMVGAEKMMLGFNIQAEDTIKYLKALSDISMGESSKFNSLTLAFSQMSATGKLMGQDLNQMINAGFNPLQTISEKTGKSIATLKDEMSKGAISAEMVQQAFLDATAAGGKFYNMSENASKTINGQISMMQDALDNVFNELGTKGEGVIMSGIQATTSLIQNYETVGKVLVGLVTTYGAYRTAVMLVTAAESKHTLVEIGLTNTRILARKAQLALNAAMLTNPYVLLAVAVGGLVTVNLTLLDTTRQLKAVEDDYNKTKDEAIAKEQKLKAETDKYLSVASNEKASTDDRKEALVKLIQKYPAIFEKYKTEAEMLQHILDIKKEISEIDKVNSVTNSKNEIDNVNKQIADLEKLAKQRYHGGRGLTNAENAKLSFLKNKRSELEETLKKEETDAILADLTGYSNSQIEAAIKDRERLLAKMQLKGVSKGTITGNSFLSGTFSKEELEGQKKLLEAALVKPSTYKQDLAKAKEDWGKAKKGYETLLKDQKATSEQVKNARDDMQAKEKSYKDLGGVTDTSKKENQAEKLHEQTEKYKLLLDKQGLERQRQQEDIENQVTQSIIDAKSDGYDKIQAQRELDNKKEIQSLKRQKEDMIHAIIQAEKEKFDAEERIKAQQVKGYKIKGFDVSSVDTSKVSLSWDAIIKNAETKQGLNEWEQREASMNEYLLKYGTFSQKKEAIDKKYRDAIEKETDLGKKNTLQKEWDEALANLDLSKLKQEINWEMVFGDLSKVTKDQLSKIKKQLQEFKQSDKFKNATPEQIQVIEGAINSINDAMVDKGGFFGGMVDSVTELKKATEELKKAEEELAEANKNGTEAQKEEAQKKVNQARNRQQNAETNVTKSSEKTIQHLTDVGNAIAQLGSDSEMSLSQFGNAVGSIVDAFTEAGSKIGGLVGAIFSVLEGIQKQGLDGFVGNVLGNVAGAVGGILDTITFGAFGFRGADYSGYQKMKEEYDSLINVWDTLISKKQQYIDISYGDEARKVGQEALDLLDKKVQSNVVLGIERLNSGASIGSHSIGVRQRKGMSKQGWDELRKAAQSIGFDYSSVADGRMTGLFDLTAEQLSKLQDEAPTFWAKLDSDVQSYLQNIIDCNTELEDMKDKLNETMTGVSFDSFYDSFVSTLADMDKSSKDMADDFGEYLKSAILSNLVANKYRTKIEALYNDWANKSDSDGDGIFDLTAEESAQLKAAQQALAEEMIAERDAMADAFGWTGNASSQSATNGGFQTMSQDTGSELNGRFTALQIAGEEIKNQSEAQSQSLNLLTAKADAILSVNTEVRNIADDTRDLIANSYLELVQISENTGAIVKPIQQMQKDIAEVKKNTEKL